jgi:hypothetical protein
MSSNGTTTAGSIGAELDNQNAKNGVYFAIVSRFLLDHLRKYPRRQSKTRYNRKAPTGPADGQRPRLDTISSGGKSSRAGQSARDEAGTVAGCLAVYRLDRYPVKLYLIIIFQSSAPTAPAGCFSSRWAKAPGCFCFSCFAIPSGCFLLLHCTAHAHTRTRGKQERHRPAEACAPPPGQRRRAEAPPRLHLPGDPPQAQEALTAKNVFYYYIEHESPGCNSAD